MPAGLLGNKSSLIRRAAGLRITARQMAEGLRSGSFRSLVPSFSIRRMFSSLPSKPKITQSIETWVCMYSMGGSGIRFGLGLYKYNNLCGKIFSNR